MLRIAPPGPAKDAAGLLAHCLASLSRYIKGSTNPQLVALESRLQARYRVFVNTKGNAALVGPSPFPRSKRGALPTHGDLLYDCYTHLRSLLSDVFEDVRSAAIGYCPYCGLRMRMKPRGRAQDKDHYLPRSLFPEFSILPANLVECCDGCNDGKGSEAFDKNGLPLFLHPYFADCLTLRLFSVKVVAVRDVPAVTFSLDLKLIADGTERAWIARHVTRLSLLERFADDVSREVTMMVQAISALSEDDARLQLLRVASASLTERPNDPLGLAIEALAGSPDLSTLQAASSHKLSSLEEARK